MVEVVTTHTHLINKDELLSELLHMKNIEIEKKKTAEPIEEVHMINGAIYNLDTLIETIESKKYDAMLITAIDRTKGVDKEKLLNALEYMKFDNLQKKKEAETTEQFAIIKGSMENIDKLIEFVKAH